MVLVTNPDGSTVNVPDQYVDQYIKANRATVGTSTPTYSPPPTTPTTTKRAITQKVDAEKKMTARERIEEKKRRLKEEEYYYNVVTGKDKGVKTFSELSNKEKRNVLVHASPITLAKQGILAPSENVAFRVKEYGKHSVKQYSPTLEKNFKSYILTGDIAGINAYLQEIYEKEGARSAFKERERLIKMGVKHTSLEGARQAGGVGTRPQNLKKEAEQRKSARILQSGQAKLNEAMFGPVIKGEVGATFDQRQDVPKKVEVQGPVQQTITGYTVDGKTFKTLEEAQKYQQSQTVETTIPLFLLPTPTLQTEEKSDTKKIIEKAYDWLETKSKDPRVRQDSEGSAIAVELGKAGLQFTGGILNLAEQMDVSFEKGYKELRGVQGPYKQVQPISFRSESADAIPINALFDKGLTPEAGKQILKKSEEYTKTYGWKPFVAGSAINLIGAGGLTKGAVQVSTKAALKLGAKIPVKIKAPIKSFLQSKPIPTIQPKLTKTYPEIAIQKQTTKQELVERLAKPTILDKPKAPSLVPSQRDVRLAVTKPKNVQLDPSYKPRGRYEGGFSDILERGKTVEFKETKVPLGTSIGRKPVPKETTYSDQKFREFIGSTEKSFKQTPVNLGTGAGRKIKQQRPPNKNW